MRRFILMAIVFVAAALAVGFFVRTQQGHAQPSVSQSDTKVVTIPIEGMSCQACAARIKRALKAIDGVAEVEISLEHRNARVRYVEDTVSPERLVAAINLLGYKAGTPRAAENAAPAGASGDLKAGQPVPEALR